MTTAGPSRTPIRYPTRGFTLVELMIVVAVIGVLAALGIYGMRKYLASAKATEAIASLGNMSRAAHASFERESMDSQTVPEGSESVKISHSLCGTAIPVPAIVPAGKKYQPYTDNGKDFDTGTDKIGWKCLHFRVSSPIYYQYNYANGSSPVAPKSPAACVADCYEAGALGDLNGNGIYSRFARTGQVNTQTGQLKASPIIYVENEAE